MTSLTAWFIIFIKKCSWLTSNSLRLFCFLYTSLCRLWLYLNWWYHLLRHCIRSLIGFLGKSPSLGLKWNIIFELTILLIIRNYLNSEHFKNFFLIFELVVSYWKRNWVWKSTIGSHRWSSRHFTFIFFLFLRLWLRYLIFLRLLFQNNWCLFNYRFSFWR